MAYIVTKNILDSKDNNRLYETGETYPRPDFAVSDSRIKALLDKGVIVSDEVAVEVKPKRRKKAEETKGE
ncbi:TPA: hypothetical protein ACGOZJ_001749 [Streptococcus suis]